MPKAKNKKRKTKRFAKVKAKKVSRPQKLIKKLAKKIKKKISRRVKTKSRPKFSLWQNISAQLFEEALVTLNQFSVPAVRPLAHQENKLAMNKEVKQAMPTRSKPFISPHIIDLKQLQADKINSQTIQEESSSRLAKDFYNKISRKGNNFFDKVKSLKTTKPLAVTAIKMTQPQAEKIIKKSSKIKRQAFKFPGWQLPTLRLPAFSWPSLNLNFIPTSIEIGNFVLPARWIKRTAAFVVICLIVISPFVAYDYYLQLQGKKNLIIEKTLAAIQNLASSRKAISAQDLGDTQQMLEQASLNFSLAKEELNNLNILIQSALKLIPELDQKYATAKNFTQLGEDLSKAAATLTSSLDKIEFSKNPETFNLTTKLITLKDSLNLILPDLKTANQSLQNIPLEEIPNDFQPIFQKLKITFPYLENSLKSFINSFDLFLQILGQDSKQRYLFIFQNNHEIRPTGGFMGSFALVDVDKGNISNINVPGGGFYDLEGNLKLNLEAPRPLHIMTSRWELQDANWFPDLPTSADKIMYLYEKSGGPTVDGIIFINASLMPKLLAITGPLQMDKYNKTITSDNFFSEVQESVELTYDKEANKPKQIIADMLPVFLEKLMTLEPQKYLEIMDQMLTALNEKEVQFYFSNYNLEKMVVDNGWGGELKDTALDYLDIVSTNIAGEKTDAKIKQTADLQVTISPDGSIINTLTLKREHLGIKGQKFYGVGNFDYLRIYVPRDSELISASGFEPMPDDLFKLINPEIYQKDPDLSLMEITSKTDPATNTEIYHETNKTVFANWVKVDPGQTTTITLQYKLPYKINLAQQQETNYLSLLAQKLNLIKPLQRNQVYSLLWQKQSGRENFSINFQITLPPNSDYRYLYPANLSQDNNIFSLKTTLNSDKFFALVFQNPQ